jgi:hypothetical protein
LVNERDFFATARPTVAEDFVLLGGTVPGREHARRFWNNQDGLALSRSQRWAVGVVTDGCSAGRANEVGARLGAAWLASHAAAALEALPAADAARTLGDGLTALLAELALALAPDPRDRPAAIADHLLFTFLLCAIGPDRAVVIGQGDGVYAVDGAATVLDSGPANAPAYLAYRVVAPEALRTATSPASLEPVVHLDTPARDLDSLLVATDGLAELSGRADEPLADGTLPGGIAELAGDPRYLQNPSLLGKRLVVLGERNHRLRDDTTVALLRRRPFPTAEER